MIPSQLLLSSPLTKPILQASPPQPHLVSSAPRRLVSTSSERLCLSTHRILSVHETVLCGFEKFVKGTVAGGGEERETCLSPKSAVQSLPSMCQSCCRCRTQRLKLCHNPCSKLGLCNEQTYPCAASECKRCHQQTRKGHGSVTMLAPVSDIVKGHLSGQPTERSRPIQCSILCARKLRVLGKINGN